MTKKLYQRIKERYFVPTERHDKEGFEVPDPTPVELPAGFKRPLSIHEMIKQALQRQELIARQHSRGEETLEESMDFGPDDDDPLPATVHEVRDMKEEQLAADAATYARSERVKKLKEAADQKKVKEQPVDPKGKDVT